MNQLNQLSQKPLLREVECWRPPWFSEEEIVDLTNPILAGVIMAKTIPDCTRRSKNRPRDAATAA